MTIIRNLSSTDCLSVAQVHMHAFPKSALGSLGLEAVQRYYHWQISGPHQCTALGAFSQGNLEGFIFAGVFHGALSGFIRKNKTFLILRVLTHPWLVSNPLIVDRLRLGLRLLFPKAVPSSPKSQEVAANSPSFGVLAIAVDPNTQKKGVGRQLMLSVEKIAIEQGFSRMQLSVNPGNQNAIQFYEKMGWAKVPSDVMWDGKMRKVLV